MSYRTKNKFVSAVLNCKMFSYFRHHTEFSEKHMGADRVKLTKCDKFEWGDKYRFASDILFELPIFNLLFYCHIISYFVGK